MPGGLTLGFATHLVAYTISNITIYRYDITRTRDVAKCRKKIYNKNVLFRLCTHYKFVIDGTLWAHLVVTAWWYNVINVSGAWPVTLQSAQVAVDDNGEGRQISNAADGIYTVNPKKNQYTWLLILTSVNVFMEGVQNFFLHFLHNVENEKICTRTL